MVKAPCVEGSRVVREMEKMEKIDRKKEEKERGEERGRERGRERERVM